MQRAFTIWKKPSQQKDELAKAKDAGALGHQGVAWILVRQGSLSGFTGKELRHLQSEGQVHEGTTKQIDQYVN